MKEVCTTLTDAELAAVCRDCDKDHDGLLERPCCSFVCQPRTLTQPSFAQVASQ